MATNLIRTSKKIMQALNTRDYKLTFNIKQFLGKDNKNVSVYSINQAHWDDELGKYRHTELYSSASMVRITLFLRDMWYKENGWELPTDQPLWNDIRKKLEEN